ncbi:hypothetical protein [Mangrovibrevibacter kandeliae]|nr:MULTISPECIES: hypothetical protein [unclassified Aurantimonas]MCQ8783137.1 hypothetical protein [Aurantimonas sp. CSK15Z-1]MCW4115620.1 hypothetical protein [Aurantimonas sp. MSK8Z-1]
MTDLWRKLFEDGEMQGFMRLCAFIAAYVLIFGLIFAFIHA